MTKGQDLHDKITGCPDLWDGYTDEQKAIWERDADLIWTVLYSGSGLGLIMEAYRDFYDDAQSTRKTFLIDACEQVRRIPYQGFQPYDIPEIIDRLAGVGNLVAREIDRLLEIEARLEWEKEDRL